MSPTPALGPRTIIVLAKEPVPGRVKTRLCPPCTPAQAAALAEAAIRDTLAAVAATPADRRVLVLDGRSGPWLPDGIEVLPQLGGPFAERLDAAWFDVIGDAPGPTVQIGMDTPQVTPDLLSGALDRLAEVPAVLGPAPDGGWWCLGLRAHLPGAFAGVPMSEAHTAERQRERLGRLLGTSPAELSLVRDVDHFTDAVAVAALAPSGAFARLVREISP